MTAIKLAHLAQERMADPEADPGARSAGDPTPPERGPMGPAAEVGVRPEQVDEAKQVVAQYARLFGHEFGCGFHRCPRCAMLVLLAYVWQVERRDAD